MLILDEPTAGLDPAGCQDILRNIRRYRDERGATVLLISHDMNIAARMADRIVVMNHGALAYDGTPREVFSHAAELQAMGLDIPASTAVAMRLREMGFDIPRDICMAAQLVEAVKRCKGGAVC